MKKNLLLIAFILLLAQPAGAQEKAPAGGQYRLETPFEAGIALGYRWNMNQGNPLAGEYEYLHSSLAGSALVEYDPLPHRFLFESYYQNSKDYFSELDYAFKDIVMLNMVSRSLYHNLGHITLGPDDPATPTPYFTDLDPADLYGVSNAMNRVQFRFKTPEFPFHIYLEVKNQEKRGTIQQRFLSAFSGGFNAMSRTRDIDWETQEAKATVNSHAGPLEFEYSHAEKKFKDTRDKVLTDVVPSTSLAYDHNLVPDIESSTDTVKIHTSHSGRVAAAATYSTGDRENMDSHTKVTFTNAAGDLTLIPWKELTVSVKYRHFEVDENNPDTVTSINSLGAPTTYSVRNAISTKRDTVSGLFRYRATQDLTFRGEYAWESLSRDLGPAAAPDALQLDDKITKGTFRLGATYRLTSRLMLRGDVSRQTAAVPANSVDNTYPKLSDTGRVMLTWMPKTWFTMLLSGGTVREERDGLGAPFTDKRKAERNRALGSFTFLIGKTTSITPSYAFFQNKQNSPIAYTGDLGAITTETAVPYADTAHVVSLAVSHALADEVLFTAEAGKSWSRGSWTNSGAVGGTTGIAALTSIKVVETTAGADLAYQFTKNLGTDLRYQIRKIDDILDDTQDGTNQIALATLTYKW